ncbi:S24 family peptidase [Xenorhabdus cabanillasii]|uniref:Predicted phage repressor n=1 Tax=Xenorhabdus cabanillasii JM26 TaxID=1427517 RepID=W1IR38_9GAMM|nr:S24 family peptidase [Xenorhabdus cabanillasii]PHM76938.1 phage repressor protein [Xenorhabdus cabanillasii JM26]CDL80096.1 Predicted phage repressor [Xenorhabdus cabanillasii JM26]
MSSELGLDFMARNIKYLMQTHGISSVKDLAKRLKMNQPTLHRTLAGEVSDPKYATLKQLADFFGVSVIDLVECDLQNAEATAIIEVDGEYYTQKFPNVPIRDDISINADVKDNYQLDEITFNKRKGYIRWPSYDKDVYAVKCLDTSLMPRVKEGEFVIVEPNNQISPGDEVLLTTTSSDTTVKTFLFERDGYYHLLNVNEDQAPIRAPKNTIKTMHYVAGVAKPPLLVK